MKKIYKIAMLLAAVALNACTIDIIGPDGPGRDIDTPRTIAVSFAPQTKSALSKEDGITPEFRPGDEIRVSNGRSYDTRPIEFDHNGGASFTTDLTGELIAVYPAKAAKHNGSQIEGVIVLSQQTGRFKDANIAMAKIKEGANLAVFENQTAVLKFYVDASIGVNSIEIRSDKLPIADNESLVINVKNDVALDQITDDPTHRIAYVAVLPGTSSQLTITSYTQTQDAVKRVFNNVSLPANTLANVFIPYYIQVGDQKWAYCNLGAFLPEETGEYFAWGDLSGAKYLPEKDHTISPFFKGGSEHLFSWQDCPFNDGKDIYSADAFNTFKDNACPNGVLSLDYDAAHKAWGDKWRMPTKYEFEKLKNAGSGYSGGDFKVNSLLLPITGHALYQKELNTTICNWGNGGVYWSSTLNQEQSAYSFYFADNTGLVIDDLERNCGLSIRPIYGDPLPEENGLKVDKYDQGSTL